jgi:hypothetical protein
MVGGNVWAVVVITSQIFCHLAFSSSISYTPGLFIILPDTGT